VIIKKVCMLGSFAVGRTSLVARFVHGRYSEAYLTTLGVKIDKKVVALAADQVNMQLWDLAGDDAYQPLKQSYLRGSGGFLLVADGTRPDTLTHLAAMRAALPASDAARPFALLLNKWDLADAWALDAAAVARAGDGAVGTWQTSAKTGAGVEEAFTALAQAMVADM